MIGSTKLRDCSSLPRTTKLKASALPTVRERIEALRLIPRLLSFVWRLDRRLFAGVSVSRFALAAAPIMSLLVAKLILDEVIAVIGERGAPLHRLWALVALELSIVLAQDGLSRLVVLLETLQGNLFADSSMLSLMEQTSRLDVEQLETAVVHDQLARARQGAVGRQQLLSIVFGLLQSAVTLFSLSVVLFSFMPALLPLVVAVSLPGFCGDLYFTAQQYALLFGRTELRRRREYLALIGVSERTARDVKTLGIGAWLSERYRRISARFYEEGRRISVRHYLIGSGIAFLSTALYYGGYVAILLQATSGVISVGSLMFIAGAFQRAKAQSSALMSSANSLSEHALYLRDYFAFLDIAPSLVW